MRCLPRSIVLATLSLTTVTVAADEPRPRREARSENGRFVLRLEPGRPGRSESSACIATLLESAATGPDDRDSARRRWRRPLVNDTLPGDVVIRDDGKFVVTLDEIRRGGLRNTLVVYGERGQLLRHFLLTDLLAKADWQVVKNTKRSLNWLDGARYGFVSDADQFLISLRSGREIRIDLKTLRVLRDGEAAGGPGDVPPDILAALADDRDTDGDAMAASDLSAEADAATAQLHERVELEELHDESADAAAAQSEASFKEGLVKAGIEAAIPSIINEAVGRALDEVAFQQIEDAARAAEEGSVEAAGADDAVELMPPMPNPADPVDYVAWANEQAQVEGKSALPALQDAVSQVVPWNGDQALYDRAMRGDPEALASPEISAWLDANRQALANYHEGTQGEFRGWPMKSIDGSMIGILLPNLAPMRQLAKTSIIDGKRLEAEGRTGEAIGVYMDTLKAGAQAGHGPTLIENLVGVAMQGIGSEALLDSFARDSGQIDYGAVAAQLEQKYQPTRPTAEAIQFERAMFLDALQHTFEPDESTGRLRVNLENANRLSSLVSDSPDNPIDRVRQSLEFMSMDYDQTLAEGNRMYDMLAAAVSQPYSQGKESLAAAERGIETTTNPMLKVLTPAISRAHFIKTRSETNRRASLLVTNLQAYKQQHGTYPDSLDAFSDREFAVDPFTGGGFAYRRTDDGFTLYSLGGNGTDDGGQHDAKGEQGDMVYWPRPLKK